MDFAYVGTMRCGCRVAAVCDDPGDERSTSKWVAGFIRDGYTVTREPLPLPVRLSRCIHKQAVAEASAGVLFDTHPSARRVETLIDEYGDTGIIQ